MRTKNQKKTLFMNIFFLIFGIAGLCLLIGGVLLFSSNMKFQKHAVKLEAEIVSIETHRDSDGDISHSVYVSYDYNRRTYDFVSLGSYSSDMYVGKIIEIYCDPEKPGHIMSGSGIYLAPIILLIMGLVFFLVGFIPIMNSISRSRLTRNLLANGQLLHATVERITLNQSFAYNGQNPFVIICTYKDEYSGTTYRFKSDHIWTDPSYSIQEGDSIDVYVKPDDFSKYIVDVDSRLNNNIVDFT